MRKTKIITSIVTALFLSQVSFASDIGDKTEMVKEAKSDSNKIEKTKELEDKSLSPRERIKIKLDEKKRLRTIAERRERNNSLDLISFYIEELKYDDKVKALLREAAFYFDYLIKNFNNPEAIKKEARNISLNSLCLASLMPEQNFFVVLESITNFKLETDADKLKFEKANEHLFKIFRSGDLPVFSKEEVDIRCKEVY